ncbi:winged helix DNA-binding domain-containing protein [Tessaracoccus palaemonis]|uniref:Winged helix DNA-binding domain-containing protein n=1 Tax=Tessaracoccus palaemonis TaxID=2829499 RepID=A0ABX8SIG4_9ACTN|nr:winged helix DNA-binding domain-containing protein [Tessaracoccus palaemonis]QXT63083.1 winged helix DNA-binding domain-containing protein [Tessaracoccus palaemonis]
MEPVRHVSDDERRHRLGIRHALAHLHRVRTVREAADSVVALHATDPDGLNISAWTRMLDPLPDDMELALARTTLIRQQSMRRTVFAMDPELLPTVLGSVGPRMATAARKELTKGVVQAGFDQAEAWIETALASLVDAVSVGALTASDIRRGVPETVGSYRQGIGRSWESTVHLTPKVIRLAELEGLVVRLTVPCGPSEGRLCWLSADLFRPDRPRPDARQAWADLARRWLRVFGPGTVEDFAWWSGGTKAAVRQGFKDVGAVPVTLDAPTPPDPQPTGWLLPDDVDPVGTPGWWVSLLPVLDPTVMGWKERGFLLGGHAPLLFDSIGNAGTAAVVNGRVVGVWVQDERRRVRVRYLESVDAWAQRALRKEAERLTAHLGGTRAFPVYPSPAMQG